MWRSETRVTRQRQFLLVLVQLHRHLLNGSAQLRILGAGCLGGFLELLYLGLKVLEVLLFPLAEGALSSAILSLSFLDVAVRHGSIATDRQTIKVERGCSGLLTELGSFVSSLRPGFFGTLPSLSRLLVSPSSFSAESPSGWLLFSEFSCSGELALELLSEDLREVPGRSPNISPDMSLPKPRSKLLS